MVNGFYIHTCPRSDKEREPPSHIELVNVPVDANAAAKRLSAAIKFKTISNQDRKDFDEKAFKGFHKFLVKTYPLAHKAMKREVLGNPRKFSLLYTWQGSNPGLLPVVLGTSGCRSRCAGD